MGPTFLRFFWGQFFHGNLRGPNGGLHSPEKYGTPAISWGVLRGIGVNDEPLSNDAIVKSWEIRLGYPGTGINPTYVIIS